MINDGIKLNNTSVRSFLMIGQSNMAGRGNLDEVKPIKNPLCYMLRMGKWQIMSEPINTDRSSFEGKYRSGIGLAASFADEVAKNTGEMVGLIPCADGGTGIDEWMPGELLYDHALLLTRLAMRSSVLSGIIWHQGESDCRSEDDLLAHTPKFVKMISSLRSDLGMPELPLIIGELSEKITEKWGMGNRPARMNAEYRRLEGVLPACKVVSAEGLTLKPDGIHFDSASLRVFGRSYFEAYLSLTP